MRWHRKAAQDITQWHSWFAWHPVRIPADRLQPGVYVWLERIERQVFYGRHHRLPSYRLPKKKSEDRA